MAANPASNTTPSSSAKKSTSNKDQQTLLAVLQYLKKNKLTETEKIFMKEANCDGSVSSLKLETTPDIDTDISSVLSAYNSEADPTRYEDYYTSLQAFVEKSLDVYKPELAMILYPLFIHMYLELVYKGHEDQAKSFFTKFRECQEDYHEEDIRRLSAMTRREHMSNNEFIATLRSNKFVIRMSRDTYQILKKHLQEQQMETLLKIIQQHLHFDVFEGRPRNKKSIDATSGGITGEATFEANKTKVYYGLQPEPDLGITIEDDNEEEDDKDKLPKKKKPKKENGPGRKKFEYNPNAPPLSRVPFPELKDSDKIHKAQILKESAKKLKLSAEVLPSICFYSLLNTHEGMNCATISDDATLLCAGFEDSSVRVWSLTPRKLRSLKPPSELNKIDKEAEDVMERIMDDKTASESRRLVGHSGPVFAVSIDHDNKYLLTSSEDKTIRLWSLFTFTTLVCYRGHNYPVWDVQFCPRGHYFASASHDGTARLWSTDHQQPIRIFAGHVSDVNKVVFHPNCNYVATGSSDRTVRLWDVTTGTSVRLFTGHKAAVHALAFSRNGRHLVSSGVDARILVWDLAEGTLVTEIKGHTDAVYSLCFSRDGTILASGGLDDCVKLWNANSICNQDDDDDDPRTPGVFDKSSSHELGSYPTKKTPIHCLHFTFRNLLLSAGPFHSTT